MIPAVINFTGNQAWANNSSFSTSLTWLDQNGNPIDLTGYNAKMSIGDNRPPSVTYLTLSNTGSSPAITIPTPTNGQILITVPQSTISSAFGTALAASSDGSLATVYDLLLYPPDAGNEFQFALGNIQIVSGVTSP